MASRVKLTKSSVERLTSDAWDTELKGFGVRVYATGRKVFTLFYRLPGSRRMERLTLGQFGTITVDDARKAARAALADAARGVSATKERNLRRDSPTVHELGELFLDDVRARRKRSTAVGYIQLWNRHIVGALGNLKIIDVTSAHIGNMHRRLSATPYQANRMLALVGSFFSFAEQQGVRAKHSNPAHEIKFFEEHARERFLTPIEMGRLSEALVQAETVGLCPAPNRRRKPSTGPKTNRRLKKSDRPRASDPVAVAVVRFLLLSGWREGEALTLRWSDVDFSRGVATLPDTKTGRSIRPLGAPALLMLSQLPRLDDAEFVFPGRDPKKPRVEINRVWYAIRHAANLEGVRLHDLRHSFASAAASSGGSLLMIGKLLGHRDSSTTAKYAHLLDDPVKATADATATTIASWLNIPSHDRNVEASVKLKRIA